MSRTMIRNLVLGLVLAASAGVQGLYAQRYPERRVLRAGNALYEQENYPEAEIRYRKAQEQSPTYEGLFNLADALYKQKRYDEALNILKQISRDEVAGPHAPDAYYNLGNTYFQQKKLPEAAEAYKNALRRNPLDDEARYNLAYVLELMKQNQDDKNDQNQNKNRVNTEQMMALCLQSGMTVQEDCAGSDVVVVNTCGFIDSAKLEAIETILSVAELKAAGRVGKILVTGCLSQRYQAELLEELPEVDGIMGTGSYGDIVSAVEQVAAGQKFSRFADISGPVEELPRVISTPMHYAYLRIAEGCSNRCAYCIIPALRGKYRSRRMEDILTEAKALSNSGVKECIVIAQDITRYGTDLNGEHQLAQLLQELCKLDFHWIRLHYL